MEVTTNKTKKTQRHLDLFGTIIHLDLIPTCHHLCAFDVLVVSPQDNSVLLETRLMKILDARKQLISSSYCCLLLVFLHLRCAVTFNIIIDPTE